MRSLVHARLTTRARFPTDRFATIGLRPFLTAPMPRKLFRKFLPSHESIRQNRYVARFGPRLQHHNLWHLHRRSVAGGVAVGLFAGLDSRQQSGAVPRRGAARDRLPASTCRSRSSSRCTPIRSRSFRCITSPSSSGSWRCSGSDATLPPIALACSKAKASANGCRPRSTGSRSVGKPLLVGLPLLALLLAAGRLLARRLGVARSRRAWNGGAGNCGARERVPR